MGNKAYSGFIMDALDYIDKKIELLDNGSVNKEKLHNAVHMQLVIKVKRLFDLTPEKCRDAVDDLFRTELNNEITRGQEERNPHGNSMYW